jgi:hypothetical protein
VLSPETRSIFVFSKDTVDGGFLLEFDFEDEELTTSIGPFLRDSLLNRVVVEISA